MYKFCLIALFVVPFWCHAYIIEQNTTDSSDDSRDCRCDIEISVVNLLVNELEAVKQRLTAIEKRKILPMTCLEAAASSAKSGIYEVLLKKYSDEPFEVFCDEDDYENAEGGGWTVIQRRIDESVDFYRSWDDYKVGFGDLAGNYWLGLDKLHAFTTSCEHELYIVLQRFNHNTRLYAKYKKFVISDETQNYNLTVLDDYVGSAGDSLIYHKGKAFTTRDRDHDNAEGNCAEEYTGAWWYNDCYYSNLNGDYKGLEGNGIAWNNIEKDESLKFAQMMIRPTKNCIKRLQLMK